MKTFSSNDTVSAGFKGATWDPGRMPEGVSASPQVLRTSDGATVTGLLYSRGGEQTVVAVMHPREFTIGHYVIPEVLRAGCACWMQASRSPGNDLRLEHELTLLDVAAGVGFLREQAFSSVVLLGNSGGAGLFTFYNQQALLEPGERISHTPSGRPTKLSKASMPVPDGMILLAPHPGQGKLLMNSIDPSLCDESDPLSLDSSLSPFDPANGFNTPPNSSTYATEFVSRYRAGQRDRVARIDSMCRDLIAHRKRAREQLITSSDHSIKVRAAHRPIFTVWRTDADLRCFDLSMDPSDRSYGSLWGKNPLSSNYGSVGFARVCTPESWLSTWSGLTSNAALAKTLPAIEQPTLFLGYTGDNSVFPGDARILFDSIGSSDKTEHWVRGTHHGRPLAPNEVSGRILAGERISEWLAENFVVITDADRGGE